MSKYWLLGLLLILLLPGCGHPHKALQPPRPSPSATWTDNRSKVSPAFIKEASDLLVEQFVEPVKASDLMAGAKAGLLKYAESCGVQDDPLSAWIPPDQDPASSFVSLLSDVEGRHPGKVTDEGLVYAALHGLMGSLDDPYSVALDPTEYRQLTEQMSGGNIGGIGMFIARDQRLNKLIVAEPVEDTPASRAGLQAGDWILKINDKPTDAMDFEVAVNKIRGPVGTAVRLTVSRPHGTPREVHLLRELIHVKSASYQALPDYIGYIKLRFFGQETSEEFEQVLEHSEKDANRALIIDLRNNGGGYIKSAIDVCSCFMPKGAVVVSVVGRGSPPEVDRSSGSNHAHVHVVLLVNGFTASASEITAGALQDAGVAILMGSRTFGKGSVQTIHDLADGGALKFTIAHYLTPKRRNINKKGITPDVVVNMPLEQVGQPGDKQLQAAVDYLRKKLEL
ncbi:MAG: S41 family peptidase [Candidatus Xenobia bacterium]